jgi:hypothetical protein
MDSDGYPAAHPIKREIISVVHPCEHLIQPIGQVHSGVAPFGECDVRLLAPIPLAVPAFVRDLRYQHMFEGQGSVEIVLMILFRGGDVSLVVVRFEYYIRKSIEKAEESSLTSTATKPEECMRCSG